MPLDVALPLLSFIALAICLLIVLRRLGAFLTAMREADAFRNAVLDLGERVDTSLGGVIDRVDAVRRHQVDATLITDNLSAATDAVLRYSEEVRGLQSPLATESQRDQLVGELERAGRALEMVTHGCVLLLSGSGPTRELEAQTSIKRGYLNLIHAREAIARVAGEVAAVPLPGGDSVLARRAVAARPSPRDHTM
jgi:hypothetical protein